MYVPAPFRETEPEHLHAFLRADPFAALCAVVDHAPIAVHIPLLLDDDGTRLIGHAARQGPFVDADGAAAVAIFSGPQGYISPSWYASKRARGRVVPHPWSIDDAPEGYVEQASQAVIGVELHIERLEGQFKLSQNRSERDVAGVVDGLRGRARPDDLPLADHVAGAER